MTDETPRCPIGLGGAMARLEQGPSYEEAIFGLSDVPDNWEIELRQDFVDHLDRLNRPWRYEDIPRPWKATFWRAGEQLRQYIKDYEEYRAEVAFFERLWGRHRFRDYHFKRGDPRRRVDTGSWIWKHQLDVLRKGVDLSDEELEEKIVGLRAGASSQNVKRYLKFDKLPICPNKWWAWLLGLYFSSGDVHLRDRYYNGHRGLFFRVRVHHGVIPLVEEVASKAGSVILSYRPKSKPLVKATGLGTTTRPYVTLPWPVFLVLSTMGLPTEFLQRSPTGSGARSYKPRIPAWIRQDNEFMRAFIEGYINGGRCYSTLAPEPQPRLGVLIKAVGEPECYVKQFLLDVKEWFDRHGFQGCFRRIDWYQNSNPNIVQYELSFHNKAFCYFLLEHFRIRRPDLRARLIIRTVADKNKTLYEALRILRTPDNVLLGLLLERPMTEEQIGRTLQIRKEGIKGSLRRLQQKGMIRKGDDRYYFDLEQFGAASPRRFLEMLLGEKVDENEFMRIQPSGKEVIT